MDRQIVGSGLTYNAGISFGDQHFEMEKNIYVAAFQILDRLRKYSSLT